MRSELPIVPQVRSDRGGSIDHVNLLQAPKRGTTTFAGWGPKLFGFLLAATVAGGALATSALAN